MALSMLDRHIKQISYIIFFLLIFVFDFTLTICRCHSSSHVGSSSQAVVIDAKPPIEAGTCPYIGIGGKYYGGTHSKARIFNVWDFGANGDDTVDDSPAIQAAIYKAANCTSYGSIVYIPGGKYYLKKKLSLKTKATSGFPAKNLTIRGDGYSSFLAFNVIGRAIEGPRLSEESTENITIENLRIGAYDTGYARGIDFNGGKNITIRNNDISGANKDCESFPDSSGIMLANNVSNIRIINNNFHDNGSPTKKKGTFHIRSDATKSNNVLIQGNTMTQGSGSVNFGIGLFNFD
jgi:hypothetical protein